MIIENKIDMTIYADAFKGLVVADCNRLNSLDRMLRGGIRRGELQILVAHSNVGKSLIQEAMDAVEKHK